jgi:hypothetical protein
LAFQLEISESSLTALAEPRLRLFLSVDVVGSTAFKHQAERTDAQGWLEFFTSFYSGFPNFLSTAHAETLHSKNHRPEHLAPALLWKALGDELVFVAEITHRSQVELHLIAFKAAVSKAVTYHVYGEKPLPIHFKASAWLAGFPVGNAAIPTDGEKSPISFDFVGPAIDIGFRLGTLATPRRFVVSVELAYLILSCAGGGLKFHYEGKSPLRGVLNGRGYPHIWIDCYKELGEKNRHPEHEVTDAEDDLLKRGPADEGHLRKFCKSYIDEIGSPLFAPFIDADPNEGLPKPIDFEKIRELVEVRLRDLFIVRSDEEASPMDAVELEEKVGQIEERIDDLSW